MSDPTDNNTSAQGPKTTSNNNNVNVNTGSGNQNNGTLYWEIEPNYPGRHNSPWVRRGDPQSPAEEADLELQGLIRNNGPYHNESSRERNQDRIRLSTRKRLILHLIRFCETTSLRGIPRIVKVKDRKRKCLWGSFVLTFFIGCITCLVFLTIQYVAYDVIHQPKKMMNYPTPFPSFTVCNTQPLSVEGKKRLEERKIASVRDWVDYTIGKAKAYRKKQEKKKRFTAAINYYMMSMFTLPAWFQALPQDMDIQTLGQERQELILRCTVLVRSGNYIKSFMCDHIGIWANTFSVAFGNCYSYTVDERYRNITMTMNIHLYLGKPQESCESCMTHTIESQVDGVRLEVHGAGTYPTVNEKGLYLMPGTLTEIRFSTQEWRMMEPPHGKCNRNLVERNIVLNAMNFSYSEEACTDQEYQKEIARDCDCIDFEKPITSYLNEYHRKRQYCTKVLVPSFLDQMRNFEFVHETVESLSNQTDCVMGVRKKYHEPSVRCFSPCVYHTYSSSVSSTRWPSPSFQESLYQQLKDMGKQKVRLVKKRFRERNGKNSNFTEEQNEEIKLISRVHERLRSALRRHKSNGTLMQFYESRFLTVQISRPDFDIEKVEEKAVISLTSFLSQAGGLLSVWVGLTFVCIVEVIELFLNVSDTLLNRET